MNSWKAEIASYLSLCPPPLHNNSSQFLTKYLIYSILSVIVEYVFKRSQSRHWFLLPSSDHNVELCLKPFPFYRNQTFQIHPSVFFPIFLLPSFLFLLSFSPFLFHFLFIYPFIEQILFDHLLGDRHWANKNQCRTSLLVQWLRIRLPMQGTRVRTLVWEDPTCRRATKPVHHNDWACALEPASHNYWAHVPRARAPQQEKPPRWEARALQRRVAPTRHN